jgi:hypothetical protein
MLYTEILCELQGKRRIQTEMLLLETLFVPPAIRLEEVASKESGSKMVATGG